MDIIKIFSVTTIAFIVSMLLTPLWTSVLYKFKLGKNIRNNGDTPQYSAMHEKKRGTPTMGGVLIWGTTLLLLFGFSWLSQLFPNSFFQYLDFLSRFETWLPAAALGAAALVGLVDDIWDIRKFGKHGIGIRFRSKLLMYAAIALVGSLWFFFKLDWDIIRVPLVGTFAIGWWYIPLFLAVIIGTSFSVNEIDGLDGLAAGTLLTSFAAYGVISFAQGKIALAVFCGAIAGALLAFLWFNIYPARFFMGDTGSLSLGGSLAAVAIIAKHEIVLAIIGGLFVLETVSVIIQVISFKLTGKRIFKMAPIHHHFEQKGWAESTIVIRFWIIAIILALIGLATLKLR